MTKAQTRRPKPEKRATKLASDRIREAARDLFYNKGIRAVGVDEIVARAGVTKPSLYRSFASKDDLTAACLGDRSEDCLRRFEAAFAEHPGDAQAGLNAWLSGISQKATKPDYRGCALTNAAIEYPERRHPARLVAAANKRDIRARLKAVAETLGARDPAALGDALLLLIEGAYMSGQLFGRRGPARVLADAAQSLIGAYCQRRPRGGSGK